MPRAARLLALACAALGCDGGPTPTRAPDARPNLLLISIDTLRADRLGCYGAARDTSPSIDTLAADGVLFETALAPTSWTLPSHVTLLTGLSPFAHQVEAPDDRLDALRRTLAQQLEAAGYETAAFVSAPFLHAAYGFGRGFGVYENLGVSTTLPASHGDQLASHADQTAPQVIDRALAWLSNGRRGSAPFFLFVHLWDPHYDYIPPERFVRAFDPDYDGDLDPRFYELNPAIHAGIPARDLAHLRARYDAEIRWTDSQLARLLDALDARGLRDDTVVSLVSDHGEEFFEHGRKGHRKALYEESVRVPWILRHPPSLPAGRRLRSVVALEDVAPTLLALLGAAPLAESTGRDLTPHLGPQAPPIPERPALLAVREQVALRGATYKLLLHRGTGELKFFDLEADPGERQPRDAQALAPAKVDALRARLRREGHYAETLPRGERQRVELDEATRARLRELGYVD